MQKGYIHTGKIILLSTFFLYSIQSNTLSDVLHRLASKCKVSKTLQ
jgi:hypothetical protein